MARRINLKKQSLEVWLNYWLGACVKHSYSKGTYTQYSGVVKNHIAPALGNIALCDLRKNTVQKFFNGLVDEKLSAITVKNIYYVIHSALKTAVEMGIITENAADNIKLPEAVTHEMPLLEFYDLSFLNYIVTECSSLAAFGLMIVLYTGARKGELLSMKWSDFEDDGRSVTIANRTVPIITSRADEIMKYKARQREAMAADGLEQNGDTAVVLNSRFERFSRDGYNKLVRNIAKKSGIPNLTLGMLRNTFGASWLEAGVGIAETAYFMGDATVGITERRFAFLIDRIKKSAEA